MKLHARRELHITTLRHGACSQRSAIMVALRVAMHLVLLSVLAVRERVVAAVRGAR